MPQLRLAQDLNLQDAERYARSLFMEDPGLSIDAAARDVNDHCRRGLHKNALSIIRNEVRALIESGRTKAPAPAQVTLHKAKEPFNPPRIKEVQKEEPVQVQEDGPAHGVTSSSRDERVRFAEDWALENPLASVNSLREALYEKFQTALGSDKLSSILKTARAIEKDRVATEANVRSLMPKHEAPAASQPSRHEDGLVEIVRQLRARGIRRLVIHEDGEYDVAREVTERGRI